MLDISKYFHKDVDFQNVKRHYAIGTGDFSYMSKVACHESPTFPFIITYVGSVTYPIACMFEEMPHSGFAAHLGFSHNAS